MLSIPRVASRRVVPIGFIFICLSLSASCTESRDARPVSNVPDAPSESEPLPAAAKPSTPRFAVHLGSAEPSEAHTVASTDPAGHPIFIAPDPLVTLDDVQRIERSQGAQGQPAILIELKPAGAERLLAAADLYLDRQLAVVWNGEVIAAPFARSPLSSAFMIVASDHLSPERVEAIAQAMEETVSTAGDEAPTDATGSAD